MKGSTCTLLILISFWANHINLVLIHQSRSQSPLLHKGQHKPIKEMMFMKVRVFKKPMKPKLVLLWNSYHPLHKIWPKKIWAHKGCLKIWCHSWLGTLQTMLIVMITQNFHFPHYILFQHYGLSSGCSTSTSCRQAVGLNPSV